MKTTTTQNHCVQKVFQSNVFFWKQRAKGLQIIFQIRAANHGRSNRKMHEKETIEAQFMFNGFSWQTFTSQENNSKRHSHFIRSLPNYESHYTRNSSSTPKKYLAPNLNMKKLYEDYTQQFENPISMYMFRDTFYRKFNLRFKPPLQDTCDVCNKLEMKIKVAPLKTIERMDLIQNKTDHLQLDEYLDMEFKEYKYQSKNSADEQIVLVFDLEKVFPTPKLTTNKAYYKRQLNTYNFCVHDETHNRSYMYVWHEGIASRGPQEITSCLFYHVAHFVPKECQDIIAYSDSCGGQNRNVKTSVILSYLLTKSDTLRSITQHFYRPGHSYNVCDRKIALIEKKRKKTETVEVPSDWIDVIKSAKETHPKFEVIEMNASNFFSCDELLKQFCTNRKKNCG